MATGSASLAAEHQRAVRAATSRRQVHRVQGAVGAAVAAAGLGVGGVLTATVTWWAGLIGLVVVAVAAWFAFVAPRLAQAEDRVVGRIPSVREADPATDARLLNLLDGLVASAGLGGPRCFVSDEPVRNVLVAGRAPGHGCVVVTSGLLASATRMELEGLVARAVVTIRDGTAAATTLALALGGTRLLAVAGEPPAEADSDLAAAMLTRYPPGLAAAFRRILDVGPPSAPGGDPGISRLWLAPPGDAAGLAARAQVLEEL